jgi:hypothetical protein
MKSYNTELKLSKLEYTSDSFIIFTSIYFRRKITTYRASPGSITETNSDTFHVYDLSNGRCLKITAGHYYKMLVVFMQKGGLSKPDEKYLYDKVIDNNFAMYVLLTSTYM